MAEWSRRVVPVEEMMATIERMGAASTRELKTDLRTDSESVRRAMGHLMVDNRIFPMAYQNAVVWMKVTGQRGRPNVKGLRVEAGLSPTIRARKSGSKPKTSKPSKDVDAESVHEFDSEGNRRTPEQLQAIAEAARRYREALTTHPSQVDEDEWMPS